MHFKSTKRHGNVLKTYSKRNPNAKSPFCCEEAFAVVKGVVTDLQLQSRECEVYVDQCA